MADLSITEKRQLERLFDMGSGFVLNFSNRPFSDFVLDSCGCDIYGPRYNSGIGSKASRPPGFLVGGKATGASASC